jgi:hypothetical protein
MKKETLKIIVKLIVCISVGVFPPVIAFKCCKTNQAKHVEKSTVKTSQPSRIDKVASTKNEKKIAWMEQIYNTK